MKRFAVPLAALAIAACSDMSTAPLAEEAAAASTSASFSSSTGANAIDYSADFVRISSITAGFNDSGAAKRFADQMAVLSAGLNAGDVTNAAQALQAARQELVPGVVGPGDMGYIELVLRSIDQTLAK